jgi:riboflavin synthase
MNAGEAIFQGLEPPIPDPPVFTGLITAVGTIRRASHNADGLDLSIAAPFRGLRRGESIAVDGACLTVTRQGRGWFTVRVVDTTLDRTRFADSEAGDRVNLERALRAGDRLGGHFVQGHVDGLGTVRSVTRRKDAVLVDVRVPASVARVSVPLGSITVDGGAGPNETLRCLQGAAPTDSSTRSACVVELFW